MKAALAFLLLFVTSCAMDTQGPKRLDEMEPVPAAGIRDDAPILDRFQPPPPPDVEPVERKPRVEPR